MKRNRNLIIGFILTTTVGFIAFQNGFAPQPENSGQTPPVTYTSTITATYEACGYIWAYHEAPELKEKIDIAISTLNPDAHANVSVYGEDCVYSDGKSTFSAMETDFYIYLTVENLSAEETFGNWMAQVMPLIIKIPREEINGNYGFVEFWFETINKEKLVERIPIQKYITEAKGKTGLELFRLFYSTP